MRKSQLNRRVFLRGAGSVVISLPFLEEQWGQKAWAQTNSMPHRLITMSFGLGLEKALQQEGFNGPLAPLQPIANKAAFFSNLHNNHLSGNSTAHFEVGATQFTGVKQDGKRQANGASLEQIMRTHFHPNGVPSPTGLLSKSTGIWSRTGSITQYVRHWNSDGSPGEKPERRPSKVFDALFGNYQQPSNNPNESASEKTEQEKRIRRSILDTVLEQYRSLTSVNSYLGKDSKDKINNHLETIRALEKELIEPKKLS